MMNDIQVNEVMILVTSLLMVYETGGLIDDEEYENN
jgi:hypothetical protein